MSTADLRPSAWSTAVVRGWTLAFALALLAAVALEQRGSEIGAVGPIATWLVPASIVAAAVACAARVLVVRAERLAWALLATALFAYALGDVYRTVRLEPLDERVFPSPADALWLSVYPLALAAFSLVARHRLDGVRTAIWLDAVLGGAALASVWVAVAFGSILSDLEASAPLERAILLAYPVGDLLLVALAVGVFALAEWSPGPSWLLLGGGFVLFAAANTIRNAMIVQGDTETTLALLALWPLGLLAVGLAAWLPTDRRPARADSRRGLLLPAAATSIALAVLVYASFRPVDATAVWLAALAIVAAILRATFTVGEVRALSESRHQALTDDLTGLGNRRRLLAELGSACESGDPHTLFLFDLDGFKSYNDRFGHVQGDALLSRLGKRLGVALERGASAYRPGGDEFCVLVPGRERVEERAAAYAEALSESGHGFTISCACGWALLPDEASEPSQALRLADTRMYGQKNSRPGGAKRQAADVALEILTEQQPDLEPHLSATTALAVAVGRRMGLAADDLDDLERAASLHDIGKVALPTSILEKTGELDEDEIRLLRGHPVVGERMLSVAPALERVAKIVRSTHERFDGAGYPDGIAGEEIPLAARVIAVCDAFDAMTTPRAYRAAFTERQALAELRRGAGTQFDPAVVAAFEKALADSKGRWSLLRRAS